jgi:epoxide hydrolase-like predicted phosphatase
LKSILQATAKVEPKMVEAIRILKRNNFKVAAVTNNWFAEGEDRNFSVAQLGLFDQVFESRALGINKPDPRIYEIACTSLQVAFNETIFLDDIGNNLKSAAALGITTIKVDNPISALKKLEELVKIPLLQSTSKL